MSIATTQTPEGKSAHPPLEGEILLDRVVSVGDLGRASIGDVIDLHDRSLLTAEEPIERVPPKYTFDNYTAIRDEVETLYDQITRLEGERAALIMRAQILTEAISDFGLLPSNELSVLGATASLETVMNDIAGLTHQIDAKSKTRNKLVQWQQEVEVKLEKDNDATLRAYKDAQAIRPPRLGALNRSDGTIADRTPR